ncbi:MAG: hypothetical protein EBY36_02345 [Gammaproteobacteria bacterium]|nr:hypothetical protein [Gammaproteobacteria bacterium]
MVSAGDLIGRLAGYTAAVYGSDRPNWKAWSEKKPKANRCPYGDRCLSGFALGALKIIAGDEDRQDTPYACGLISR